MRKSRVSMSLSKDLVGLLDSYVDGLTVKSRSEAVEEFLRRYLSDKRTAVFLAGGDIKNLLIENTDEIRPLANIGEKTLIESNIEKCRQAGYTTIFIVGLAELISRLYVVLGDGKKYGVSIRYVEDEKPLGTAKTLEKVREHIKSDFLFLPCDHYFDFDLKKIRDFHVTNGAVATIAVHAKTKIETGRFGVVEMEGQTITSFEEHPESPKSNLAAVFIGFLKPEIFDHIPPGNVRWSLQENIFPKLAKEGNMCGYPVPGNWINIHDPSDIEKVREL
jgi:mannose-1-phosphate guanylyltransferase/phosphomannomutase